MDEREAVCGAPKDGGYRLHCELPPDHEPDWHKAVYRERREATYLGSHHLIESAETVTWEPVDHVREAVNHIMAVRNENPVATRRGSTDEETVTDG